MPRSQNHGIFWVESDLRDLLVPTLIFQRPSGFLKKTALTNCNNEYKLKLRYQLCINAMLIDKDTMWAKISNLFNILKVTKSLVQTYGIYSSIYEPFLVNTGNLQVYCTTEQNPVLLKQHWLVCYLYKSIKTIKLYQSRKRKKRKR